MGAERACDRLEVCGCWLAHTSAIIESESSDVSQSIGGTSVAVMGRVYR